MKYSKFATLRLGLIIGGRDCLIQLNNLILKEGCQENMPFFEYGEVVIDMDFVEHIIAKLNNRGNYKSMDSAFIIKDNHANEKIVFVEYRFNYLSMKNLRAKDLRDKKKYSTDNFTNIGYTNFHNFFYYVFSPNLKQQARQYFHRLYPSMPSSFKPITISDLKLYFFSNDKQ